jgi:hypothetical protein
MRSSFQLVVDLNFKHSYLTRRLFNDVAHFDRRLHVELCDISDKMYQFVFDRRENDFMTTTLQQTMFMHFFQQSTIVDCVDVVRENIDVIHEINDRYLTK